jgi:hypothetical protein
MSGNDSYSSNIGGMLSILGILSFIVFTSYVIDGLVRKSNYILEKHDKRIGSLGKRYNGSNTYLTGNHTCNEPECEIPLLQDIIPLLFNKTSFYVTA